MIVYLQMLETSEEQVRFEELVHTYKNLMFYVANQVLNNDYDAEDAVQQAFFAILKNFEKISEIKCPQTRSFVVTIVERKAIDLYRSKNRNAAIPFDEEFINIPGGIEADVVSVRTDLARAMAKLPTSSLWGLVLHSYRELLLLKYDNGYSEQEIAVMCSMTKANVKKTIYRAKKKLESLLEEEA